VRRLYGRLRAYLKQPAVHRAIQLGIIGLGLQTLGAVLKEHEQRIDTLEERGLVPIDDLVTIRDLEKVEGRIEVLEGPPLVSSAADPHEFCGPDCPEVAGEVE
jgi:hypothetical protein